MIPLLSPLISCGMDESVGGGGFEQTDSAGVIFVKNEQPERALTLREVLRVGVADGDRDHEFEDIRTVTIDPAGGFWVVDDAEGVRHYGPDGRYTGSLGGRGEGPGESEMYYSVTLDDDRALLFGVPGVLQLFHRDGTLVTSYQRDLSNPWASPIAAVDGRWILQQQSYPANERAVFRSEITFVRADSLAGPRDTIRSFPGQLSRVVGGEGRNRAISRASWFHGNPAFGVDARGRVFASDTLRYRIETYDTDGRLVRVLERGAEPRPFDPAWLSEMEAGFEESQRATRSARQVDREILRRQMEFATPNPIPEHLFFIENILVGPSGELWVERADRHPRPGIRAVAHAYGYIRHAWLPGWEAPRTFELFDADGRYEGTLDLPEDFEPMAIAGDRVYGVHYDELGVERVVVHEIEPDGGDD